MSVLLTPAEYTELAVLVPYLNIKPLTRQMEQAVLLYLRGMSANAAATAAGYADGAQLRAWLNSEEGNAVLDYVSKRHHEAVNVTRDRIATMFFEAHAKAANATEEISATRELAKLYDLYENEKRKGAVNVQINNHQNVTNVKQLERLSDAELLELAGPNTNLGRLIEAPPQRTKGDDYDPINDL